jgi:CheY-like chemotaxis protein
MGERMILLVDNEEVIQKSLSRYLKDKGYDVTTAKNGDEAIGKLKQKQYDLVMTDLVMEGTDGIPRNLSDDPHRLWEYGIGY